MSKKGRQFFGRNKEGWHSRTGRADGDD